MAMIPEMRLVNPIGILTHALKKYSEVHKHGREPCCSARKNTKRCSHFSSILTWTEYNVTKQRSALQLPCASGWMLRKTAGEGGGKVVKVKGSLKKVRHSSASLQLLTTWWARPALPKICHLRPPGATWLAPPCLLSRDKAGSRLPNGNATLPPV